MNSIIHETRSPIPGLAVARLPAPGSRPALRLAVVALIALAWSSVAFGGEIHDAAAAGDLEKVRVLLNENPDLTGDKDTNGLTPLHLAAWNKHTDVAALLLADKADVNARADDGWTPLHYAAFNGDTNMAALLLANHAEVNARDHTGWTPLHEAAFYGHKDVVELLLDNQADVNAKADNGDTPLHVAVMNGQIEVPELLRQHGGKE